MILGLKKVSNRVILLSCQNTELCKLTEPEGYIQSGLSFSCFSFIEVVYLW